MKYEMENREMVSGKVAHIDVAADNIVSPLGLTSSENLSAVLSGRSGVKMHPAGTFGVPEPFAASLLDRACLREVLEREGIYEPEKYSFLEMISILSVKTALRGTSVDPSSDDVVFILSSTKGNIGFLEDGDGRDAGISLSAKRIAGHFGNTNTPVVISNACISGVCAEIEAARLLRSGKYRRAVVTGVDCQSRFIVSGFQSFRALSAEPCRPFDRDRHGLNLGEAAATVVLEAVYEGCGGGDAPGSCGTENAARWEILDGCIRNDANHISGPSRTGEGSFRALRYLLKGGSFSEKNGGLAGAVSPEELAVVNVHGTATPYNDEMESIALSRAGLSDIPVNSLKGFFGHTMGAAGVLEIVLSMHAVERGLVLPTRGFENMGVSCPVNISSRLRQTDKRAFVKLISGFGGCNAAVAFRMRGSSSHPDEPVRCGLRLAGRVDMTPEKVTVNGRPLNIVEASPQHAPTGHELLTAVYRSLGLDYPKFFKMDTLSRLGFVTSELLLNAVEPGERPALRQDRGVIFWNRSASLCNDRHYMATISDPQNWYPSPALFVYTLPNIVCGEIAIRNKWYGETMFYIADNFDESAMMDALRHEFDDRDLNSALCGWLECSADDVFEAHVFLVERGDAGKI